MYAAQPKQFVALKDATYHHFTWKSYSERWDIDMGYIKFTMTEGIVICMFL
jgi:hypothetical protein